jgi:uncharacterized protein (TIGR02996 family)
MDTEAALLARIFAAPDDDAPRLVYADWLTDQGDPRGELIALQCQLAASPEGAPRRALKTRERQLLAVHGDRWAAPLLELLRQQRVPGEFRPATPSYEFVRGFVERLQLSVDALPDAEAIFQAAPLLRELRVNAEAHEVRMLGPADRETMYEVQPKLEGAFDASSFHRLRALDLRLGGAGNSGARAIAASAPLSGVRSLRASLTVVGDARYVEGTPFELTGKGLEALSASPHLRGLRRLELPFNRLDDQALEGLAEAAWELEGLELGSNLVSGRGATALAQSQRLAGLRQLGLSHARLGGPAALALASSKTLASLEVLDLSGCQLDAQGVQAFLEALSLPALRALRLEYNPLHDAGAMALAASPSVRGLTSLELGRTRLGATGAAALASSEHLAGLERLVLNEPRWDDELSALFVASETLANCHIYVKGRLLARPKRR